MRLSLRCISAGALMILLVACASIGALRAAEAGAAINPNGSALAVLPAQVLEAGDERQLIAILKSNASLSEKDAACAALKRAGTSLCIPALFSLLGDEQLSDSARYALESLPTELAGQALKESLASTTGLRKVGIINSLGVRHEGRAVSSLAECLSDTNILVACAAATALGQIAGPEALEALQNATNFASVAVSEAVLAGLLRCGADLLATGSPARAGEVFQDIYARTTNDFQRLAAYRGQISAAESHSLPLITAGILEGPGPKRSAALQSLAGVHVFGTTKIISDLLPKVDAQVQIALLAALSQRDDPKAAPAVRAMATNEVPAVRIAAIRALGNLGDAWAVSTLAEAAASTSGEEQKAARESLVLLRRGSVTPELLRELVRASPPVQAEIARALGERGDRSAVPRLMDLARKTDSMTRHVAVQSLSALVDESQLRGLTGLVLNASDEVARADAAQALSIAVQRLQMKRGQVEVESIASGLATGSKDARVALLPICSGLVDPRIRAALRQAIRDRDPEVHAAALRALADTIDAGLLVDLQKAACETPEENPRTIAIRGCVRLLAGAEPQKFSNAQQIQTLQAILATQLDPAQKRLVLAGLAEIPEPASLALALPLLDQPGVTNEASQAIIQIAPALPDGQIEVGERALNKVLAGDSIDAATRQAADAALKQIGERTDFITTWQVAGPFRVAGKDYAALFDITFPPEHPEAGTANWRPLAARTNPKRPWLLDLAKALGGEQCVAYARTWIYSPAEQTARLEIGADDGVKAWLNDELIHANNVARALQPGSDVVSITLHPGWNALRLKVTQFNQGWEFCARLRKPDGSHLDGWRVQAAPPGK